MPDIYSDNIPAPKKPVAPVPRLPKGFGLAPDVQNIAYLNDYRNTIPFQSYEEDTDYEWSYGSTLELICTISDELLVDELPQVSDFPYVTDVRPFSASVVDDKGIARISLGTMSKEDAQKYFTSSQVLSLTQEPLSELGAIRRSLVATTAKYAFLLYWLADKKVWPETDG